MNNNFIIASRAYFLGIKLAVTLIRNVMGMNAFFGGLAVAIASVHVWVIILLLLKSCFHLD